METKGKIIVFLSSVSIAMSFLSFSLYNRYNDVKLDYERERQNVRSLNSQIDTFRTSYGTMVAKTESLSYTIEELSKYNSELKKLFKESDVRKKYVDNVETATTTTTLRDTVVLTVSDNHAHGNYTDAWTSIDFNIYEETLDFSYIIVDTVDIIAYKDKGKWRMRNLFKRREVCYYTLSQNRCPYATTIVRSIKIK